mmetsp:Transcript_42537/g.102511  ORF Transcript_42537/g.102511 Transcript_42537/m.102511 type:complete len:252 (+) Transcript_42537:2603-3358(+)
MLAMKLLEKRHHRFCGMRSKPRSRSVEIRLLGFVVIANERLNLHHGQLQTIRGCSMISPSIESQPFDKRNGHRWKRSLHVRRQCLIDRLRKISANMYHRSLHLLNIVPSGSNLVINLGIIIQRPQTRWIQAYPCGVDNSSTIHILRLIRMDTSHLSSIPSQQRHRALPLQLLENDHATTRCLLLYTAIPPSNDTISPYTMLQLHPSPICSLLLMQECRHFRQRRRPLRSLLLCPLFRQVTATVITADQGWK